MMKIVLQENSCLQVIAEASAPTITTGIHVKLHAQTIARSILVKQVVQKTPDFASDASLASGTAIRVAILAARAVLKGHVTKLRVNAIEAAKMVGGEKRVNTNVQLVRKVAVIAKTENLCIVRQDRSRVWLKAQEFASLAPRIVRAEFVMMTVLAVKDVF